MIDIQYEFKKVLFSAMLLSVGISALQFESVRAEAAEVYDAITDEVPSSQAAPAPEPAPSQAPKKSRNSKGKYAREKEAEGSEARDRFQADTVIKSKYEQDGQALEVDPD